MSNLATTLLATLRQLIQQAQQQTIRIIDVLQVQTYWQMGLAKPRSPSFCHRLRASKRMGNEPFGGE